MGGLFYDEVAPCIGDCRSELQTELKLIRFDSEEEQSENRRKMQLSETAGDEKLTR